MQKSLISLVVKVLCLCIVAVLLGACAAGGRFSHEAVDPVYTFSEYMRSRLVSDMISNESSQYLRLNFLDAMAYEAPEKAIGELVRKYDATGNSDCIIPVSELSYSLAYKLEETAPSKAAAYYTLCAEFAYDYLSKVLTSPNSYLDVSPRLLVAAGLYNGSVSRGVLLWQKLKVPWSEKLELELDCRRYSISVDASDKLLFDPSYFDQIRSCYDFKAVGFDNYYRSSGLGASLFGIRSKKGLVEEPFHPKFFFLPTTAALEFESRPESKTSRNASLRFYNSLKTDKMDLAGRPFWIDADYTLPLNVFLSGNDPSKFGFVGLKNPDTLVDLSNIFIMEPFDPDKIPVLFVHGLFSSPATFIDTYNDLLGIPEFRSRYQSWFFYYPTGIPITMSASILRNKLRDIREKYDPEHKNPRFEDTIVVGHSMGGVLCSLLLKDSGNTFYDMVFMRPVDELDLNPVQKEIIRENMIFEHIPFVSRAVFIATPHRGSEVAESWWAKMLSRIIRLPKRFDDSIVDIMDHKKHLLKDLPEDLLQVAPTSATQLSPESMFMKFNSKTPIREGVPCHSIIGIQDAKSGPGSSDGIVPYESSHLEGAVSELLVNDSHTCVSNPRTKAEVMRILKLHLFEADKAGGKK